MNGVSERLNLTLQQKRRCLLFDSGFLKTMWAWTLKFAVNVHNCTPKKALGGDLPYVKFYCRPCMIKFLRRFSCLAHALQMKNGGKFDEQTTRNFLISCNPDCYTVFEPESGTFIRTKYVRCVEGKVYGDFFGREKSVLKSLMSEPDSKFWSNDFGEEKAASKLVDTIRNTEVNWVDYFEDIDEVIELYYNDVPNTYKDAVASNEAVNWQKAIDSEL